MLYELLVKLKPKTLLTVLAGINVESCDHGSLYKALKELIVRQNVEAVKSVEKVFQSVLNDVVQSTELHGCLPFDVHVTDTDIDKVFRSDSDYLLCVFIRYFQRACNQPIRMI